ncbi:MAG: translation elongation factor Ts [Elusimicrobiota bacterium]|jgi:elongation factor Ts
MSTATNPNEVILKLREKTGAGMMDCKKALTEAAGDYDKAVEVLRKKGLSDAAKKSTRTTKEGLVACAVTPDGKKGGIVEVNCETDFVAKTDEFRKLADELAREVAEGRLNAPEAAAARLAAVVAKIGENVVLRRLQRFELSGPGVIVHYVHTAGGKKGAMLELSCASDAAAKHEAVAQLGRELAMQTVAMSPRWVTRAEVPPADVEKEKEIFSVQIRQEGKPEAAVPKIVEGKLNKLFYGAFCLLEQPSMRDNKTPMNKLVEEAGQKAGGKVEVKRLARYQLGE